jgi:nucleoside-diphosphate-sugar epimerase
MNLNTIGVKVAKIFVAGGGGLTGKSIRDLSSKFNNFKYYFHNRELGDLANFNVVRTLLKQESPDIIILNAATLSGSHGLEAEKEKKSLNNFAIHENFSEMVSENQKILSFSSYHVFRTKPPFLKLSNTDMNEQTSYAAEKTAEIRSGWSNPNICFLLYPHLFGAYDNFEINRAHFIANSIRRIRLAKEMDSKEIEFIGNRNRVLQFASGSQSANFALELCSQNEMLKDKVINADIGWVIEIGKVFVEICDLIGYKGNIRYEEIESPITNNDMFFSCNILSHVPMEFRLELVKAIEYFEAVKRE